MIYGFLFVCFVLGFLDKIGLGALTSWMTAGGTATGEEDIDTPMATEEDIAGQ